MVANPNHAKKSKLGVDYFLYKESMGSTNKKNLKKAAAKNATQESQESEALLAKSELMSTKRKTNDTTKPARAKAKR